MKTAVILLAVVFAACSAPTKNESIEKLVSKRDSLQKTQLALEKEINELNMQIASLDSSTSDEDMKIMKQIAMQKTKFSASKMKIKSLEGQLSSSANAEDLLPVAVKEITGEPFNHYVIVYGNVEAENYALISPEMPGRIEKVYVNEGQRVNKGELLVALNTAAVDKQIEGVESSLELASTTFEKQESLWKQSIGSEMQYLGAKNAKEGLEAQLEALKAQKRMAQIRAPFNGIVDKVFSKEGELASSMMPVVEFVNLNKLIITADVSESYIDKVKIGQKVSLSFSSLDGLVKEAPIRRVSKVINPLSRTFEIEMVLANENSRIKPNMVSTIRINDYSVPDAFVIPSLTIRKDISGNYVYVAAEQDGKSVVGKKYIETSKSYQDQTLVSKGLVEGDKVITKGFHMVSSGIPVRIVE